MSTARKIAATAARWAAALLRAASERVRSIKAALRALRKSILRMYVAFEGALCDTAVDCIEVAWAIRVFVYFLAVPILSTLAAARFSRWWLWLLAASAWAILVRLVIDMRTRVETQTDEEVFSKGFRTFLTGTFRFLFRAIILLISLVFTIWVVSPVLMDKYSELRRHESFTSEIPTPEPTAPTLPIPNPSPDQASDRAPAQDFVSHAPVDGSTGPTVEGQTLGDHLPVIEHTINPLRHRVVLMSRGSYVFHLQPHHELIIEFKAPPHPNIYTVIWSVGAFSARCFGARDTITPEISYRRVELLTRGLTDGGLCAVRADDAPFTLNVTYRGLHSHSTPW